MIRASSNGGDMAEIAEITRTYGGVEGRRIKAGTRFAIGKAVDGLPTLTRTRFTQLVDAGLARLWVPGNKDPIPTPGYTGGGQAVVQKQPLESRTSKKLRAKNPGAPGEPRPLVNPASAPGSLSAPVSLESLSPADQASIKSNLGLRGRRKSSASPSTMPIASPPGRESSTAATAPGGGTTEAPGNSKG
jgi:hypothetical protein